MAPTDMGWLLVAVVLIFCILPTWPYSQSWGYLPAILLTGIMIAIVIWIMSDQNTVMDPTTKSAIKTGLEQAGQKAQEVGRDVADTIRNAVQ